MYFRDMDSNHFVVGVALASLGLLVLEDDRKMQHWKPVNG